MTKSLLVLSLMLATSATAAAEKVAAPRIASLAVQPLTCDGDGSTVPCPSSVAYLGDLMQRTFNRQLVDAPVFCGDGKPGPITFKLTYGFTTPTMDVSGGPKVWPACATDFAKQLGDQWLAWFKVLHEIDASIDIRSNYKITIQIKR